MHAVTEPLDQLFRALADPVRRRIIERLARGPATVTELGAPFDISAPAITKHLQVLEQAGLLVRHKDGRIHRCRLEPAPMAAATDWIERYRQYWRMQFANIEKYLDDTRPDAEGVGETLAHPRGPSTSKGAGETPPPPGRPSSLRRAKASRKRGRRSK